jgi:hypothetical protein
LLSLTLKIPMESPALCVLVVLNANPSNYS